MTIVFISGATAWEAQIGRLWLGLLKPPFWRTSFPIFIRWTGGMDDE